MKCQNLFSGKYELSSELAQRVVKVGHRACMLLTNVICVYEASYTLCAM